MEMNFLTALPMADPSQYKRGVGRGAGKLLANKIRPTTDTRFSGGHGSEACGPGPRANCGGVGECMRWRVELPVPRKGIYCCARSSTAKISLTSTENPRRT